MWLYRAHTLHAIQIWQRQSPRLGTMRKSKIISTDFRNVSDPTICHIAAQTGLSEKHLLIRIQYYVTCFTAGTSSVERSACTVKLILIIPGEIMHVIISRGFLHSRHTLCDLYIYLIAQARAICRMHVKKWFQGLLYHCTIKCKYIELLSPPIKWLIISCKQNWIFKCWYRE